MKKSGIALTVGIVFLCMGMKFNSVAMNRRSIMPSSSGLTAADRIKFNKQLKQLDALIAKKEQEIEKAGQFEEFELIEERNALRKQRDDIASMFTLDTVLAQSELRAAMPRGCYLGILPWSNSKLIQLLYYFKIISNTGAIYSLAWSPDGSKIVSVGKSRAKIWDVAAGVQIGPDLQYPTGHLGEHPGMPEWSSDGHKLALAVGHDVRIWNISTGTQMGEPLPHIGFAHKLLFSPDGSKLAVDVHNPRDIKIWNVNTGTQIGPNLQGATINAVAWSPDGSKLAIGSSDMSATIWDVATWTQVGPHLRHSASVMSIAWSPDGNKLATGSFDTIVKIWNATTGMQIGPNLSQGAASAVLMAWSPDGTKLAVRGWETRTIKIWNAITGVQIGSDLNQSTSSNLMVWSPDGARLLTRYPAMIWDVVRGVCIDSDRDYLCRSAFSSFGSSFSPDGTKLATIYSGFSWGREQKQIRIWNIAAIINNVTIDFLHSLNVDQCDLMQAFCMAVDDKGRIQATEDQWSIFTTFPKTVRDALRLYIKEPVRDYPSVLEESKQKEMDERVGKAFEQMWEREERQK